jgi:hypothetical protein
MNPTFYLEFKHIIKLVCLNYEIHESKLKGSYRFACIRINKIHNAHKERSDRPTKYSILDEKCTQTNESRDELNNGYKNGRTGNSGDGKNEPLKNQKEGDVEMNRG